MTVNYENSYIEILPDNNIERAYLANIFNIGTIDSIAGKKSKMDAVVIVERYDFGTELGKIKSISIFTEK